MTVMTDTDVQYRLSGWDLSELLPDAGEAAVGEQLAALEAEVAAFQAHRASLGPEIDRGLFLSLVAEYERLVERMNVLGGYASLRFSEDTGSREALALKNRVQQALTAAYNRILFFTLVVEGAGRRRCREAAADAAGERLTTGTGSSTCGGSSPTPSTSAPSRSSTSRTTTASARC